MGNDYGQAGRTDGGYVSSLLASMQGLKHDGLESKIPGDFSAASSGLMPRLRSRALVENARLLGILEKQYDPDHACEVVAEHSLLTVDYITDESRYALSRNDLSRWRLSWQEVVAVAMDNLRKRTSPDFCCAMTVEGRSIPQMAGIYAPSDPYKHDKYNATRIMLPEVLRGYAMDGDPMALIPIDESLTFIGKNHGLRHAVTHMRMTDAFTLALRNECDLISPLPLRLVGGAWKCEEYEDEDLDLPATFRFYMLMTLKQQEYLLQQMHERAGVATKVLDAKIVAADEAGKDARLTAFWPANSGEAVLPAADQVWFEGGNAAVIGRWQAVMRGVGDLMEPLDVYPMRYRVRSFPSEEQLRLIAAAS